MAITSIDGLIDALANRSQSVVVNKASMPNTVAGLFYSMWRAAGIPGAAAIPTSAAICDDTTPGAIVIDDAATDQNYVARMFAVSSIVATDLQIHDRLVHMGGLNGTLTTAQNTNINLTSTASNLALRIGQADWRDCQWWVEWYVDTGATARNLTVNVTYEDDTTGSIVIALTATMRAGRLMPIFPEVGHSIKSVNSVQLNGTTGAVGNFGITATRHRTGLSLTTANSGSIADWSMLGLPRLADDVCLQPIIIAGGTTSGTLYGTMKVIEG